MLIGATVVSCVFTACHHHHRRHTLGVPQQARGTNLYFFEAEAHEEVQQYMHCLQLDSCRILVRVPHRCSAHACSPKKAGNHFQEASGIEPCPVCSPTDPLYRSALGP